MTTDLDKLQGTWKVTALETDGQKMPATVFNGSTIVIKENKFISIGMGAKYKGTVELDQSSKPKAFDLLFTAGHAKGHRNLGIYKLDGDTWTICLATRGHKRPEKFVTTRDTGFALETLERNRVARKSAKGKSERKTEREILATEGTLKPKTVGLGAATPLEGEWEMVSGIINGVAMAQAMVKWCKRITCSNVTKVVAGPQVFLNARFTLDRTKSPHAIDYVNLDGANKGKSQAGIFELSGDTLRICVSAPDEARPVDFSSKSGDGRSFTTWRLVKN